MYKKCVNMIWCLSLLLAVFSGAVQAQESAWPRTLPIGAGSVTVYPLQVDEMNGDVIRFQAALAYRQTGVAEPVFGAGWFESRVEIDRANGVVHPLDLTVVDIRFPTGTEDLQQDLAAVFARQSPGWNLDFPLDELLTALETVEQEAKTAQNLNTSPPAIIYRDHPALLINFDGEPVLRTIENSTYQAAINTPYPLIFDGKMYYLSAAEGAWYLADRATGPYRFDANPPAEIVAMVEAVAKNATNQVTAGKVTAANAPEIVVATTPTELIVTDGPAAFVPLIDDLLVLDNSADDVFMHISSQQYYVVLAGRWYHSPSLDGPWTYRAADDLPLAFTNIPGNSDQAGSRVYVAGTPEAREAVLDAQIPVAAAVARGPMDLEVTYDGEPRFEPVEGTDLAYADNTGSTVIESDRMYYLVEDGVWYVSNSPNGPWEVSDYRPEEVAAISPRSPVYNVKYVYIYDSTPERVYVGYTPGYIGSYVYNDTIVYGTGWYYRPWISPRYYYPRYSTWGFSVGYSPWYGWNFGLSWGWGPFYAGYYSGGYWHHHHHWYNPRHGRWGPYGYRPRHGSHHRYAHNRGVYGDRDQHSANAAGSNAHVRNQNLYRDRAQRARIAETGDSTRGTRAVDRDRSALAKTEAGRQGSLNREVRGGSAVGKTAPTSVSAVTRSDLRAKAQIRDARRDALQGRLFANNSRVGGRMTQALLERAEPSAVVARAPAATQRQASPGAKLQQRNTHPVEPQTGVRPVRTQQGAAPSRNVPAADVSRQWAARGIAQPGSAPRQAAPQRATPQRSAAVRSTRQANAAAPGKGRESGHGYRSAANSARRGDRGSAGKH